MTAMFLHTFSPHPILATIGPFTIHWYGLLLSLGALAGYLVFRRLGQRYGLKPADLELTFFWGIVAGVVGARLYHVLNEWGYYAQHPAEVWRVWNGGLAIHGAVIGGLIVLLLTARRLKTSFWLLADCAAPALALGQAIGRWGNYFNQELYGRPTSLPWGIPIDPVNRTIDHILDPYYHPAFLYESLGALAIFVLLILLHRTRLRDGDRKRWVATAGVVTLVYFVTESLIRAGTELVRIDRVPMVFGVRLPLLVSLMLVVAASAFLYARVRRRRMA